MSIINARWITFTIQQRFVKRHQTMTRKCCAMGLHAKVVVVFQGWWCKSWQLQMIQHHQEFTENRVKTYFWKLHYFASSLVETWVFTYWLLRPGMSLTFRFSVKKICNPKDIYFNPWFQKRKMSKFLIMKRCSNHWFQTIMFLLSLEEI